MEEELKLTYFLMMLLILSFVLNPFLKKKAAKGIDANEYMIINHVLISVLVFIYAGYLIYNNKCDLNCFKKMNNTQLLWASLAALTSLIGAIVLIMLLTKNEVTFIIPNVQPMVMIVGAILGYLLFQESMRFYKILGIFLVVLGAICINIDKIKYSK